MASKREEKILKNARVLRAKEHKLHQPLRLTTLSQAEQFVQDRGLVSVLELCPGLSGRKSLFQRESSEGARP